MLHGPFSSCDPRFMPHLLPAAVRSPASSSASSSSAFSSYPSPRTDISTVSSATSAGLVSPCARFCPDFDFAPDDYPPSARPGSELALKHSSNLQRQAAALPPLPREQLQNPRRTKRLLEQPQANNSDAQTQTTAAAIATTTACCPLPPPSLVRQADRKVNFVDNLVDTAAQIVEAIWPSSIVFKPCEPSLGRVLPLRTFIQETLRRSRSSYSTLQVALYYLFVIRPFIPLDEPESCHDSRALHCGRRMFLAALILASKYLQDKNYSARAWSKISGLGISEINANELAFLATVNWRLHISDQIFDKWTKIVLKCTPTTSILPAKAAPNSGYIVNKWVRILSRLDMSLDSFVLDEVLSDELSLPFSSDAELALNLDTDCSDTSSEPSLSNLKLSSMAFALAAPSAGRGICNESMPSRSALLCTDDRAGARGSRKSSLSMCETADPNGMDLSVFQAPVREKILGQSNTRPEARRFASTPSALAVQDVTGRNRKRGNETPVAPRHQKKQKDKLGEFSTPKPSDVVPSGLTPQMRQMNTSFSVSGRKGNGLRMSINPGSAAVGIHGQAMRPGPGQRSASHVVYG